MILSSKLSALAALTSLAFAIPLTAAEPMPKEDVVEIPAIGAGLCVSNVFQTNMVLQRDKPLNIWGWATAGETVTVSIGGQEAATSAADDRSWQVTLEPLAASSAAQTLTVKSKDASVILENILIGDVWVLGGQSNMEFAIKQVDDGEIEIQSANFPQVRLLTMPGGKGFDSVRSFERLHEWSSWSGRHFRKGDWDICSPESVTEFSAIGYVFGRRLAMASGVPVGLIDTSVGGTTVEAWTPEDLLLKIDGQETRDMLKVWEEKIADWDPQADLEKRIANFENKEKKKASGQPAPSDLKPGPVADKNRPGACYAGIIKPLSGLAVKGALFHQGFNNCFGGSAGARMYYQVFGSMIAGWRATFADAQLPFCIISLCTAGDPQTAENFLKPMSDVGPLIREAQYQTFLDLRESGDMTVGFVSSFDQRKSWYHPQIKIPVGERAAKWAIASQYGLIKSKDSENYWLPPSVTSVEAADQSLRLTMSTEITRKDDSTNKMLGFAIAGEDRKFFPAEANYYTDGKTDNRNKPVYSRNILVLSSPFVSKPVHYRYAWARNPMANIVNNRQIPIATQRSDDWILEETPVKFPIPSGMTLQDAARPLKGKLMKELELDETERQIMEAEATIARLKESFAKDKSDWEAKKAAEAAKLEEKEANR